MHDAIVLDIISDTICPWCYIGKRRLEAALAARPEVAVDIRWRAFQLDPTIPREGVDRQSYLQRKFGAPAAARAIYDRIAAAGSELGIPFAFDRIARTPNTLDSHRLIRWAATAGVQDAVVERLLSAYFTKGADIGDRTLLTGIAEASGMDGGLVGDLLAGDTDIELVEQEIRVAQEMGVTGVPCFVFANRFGVMGAQSPEILTEALDRARGEMAAAAG